jgi:helix-turn-helix protein
MSVEASNLLENAERRRSAWRCRDCALNAGEKYVYPPSPDAYCALCSSPLDATERIAAALAALARTGDRRTGLDKPLLTASEAAAFLGTTPKGLEALRRRGKLPPSVGPGRRLLFRREDLLSCASREPSPRRTRR